MNKILLPVIPTSFGSRTDGSYRLSISTDILSDEQLLAVKKLTGQTCFMMLKDAEIEPSEQTMIETLPVDSAIMKKKSKSQQLRNVLYVLAQENGVNHQEFYDTEMDKIILHYKNKLS